MVREMREDEVLVRQLADRDDSLLRYVADFFMRWKYKEMEDYLADSDWERARFRDKRVLAELDRLGFNLSWVLNGRGGNVLGSQRGGVISPLRDLLSLSG